MAVLVGLPFAATFTFARPISAPRRNAAGAIVTSGVNVPRYDHTPAGARRGLLIETGVSYGENDALSVVAGDWQMPGPATVLIEVEVAGEIERRAVYTSSVRDTVNACVNTVGHLRTTGAVAGYLPNLGGFVRYRNADYQLGGLVATAAGQVLGDSAGRPLIESA